ncbi:hypothetical protein HanIR_Chr01g0031051 [Helianthus annuus]|nr:hypothetical protein HanIR_Chr01g0031051 [Helianthus annuus]
MEGSSKRGSGSKKKPVRPKVRANLGEPARVRLQDEPDPIPPFQTQQFPPFQTQPFPPFQPHQFQTQPFPPFQTQSHHLDPLEDDTLIHQFERAKKRLVLETSHGSFSQTSRFNGTKHGSNDFEVGGFELENEQI